MADRLSLEELKKKRQEGTHENTERKLNTRSAAITRESGGERKSLEELRQARMNRNASPDVSVFHNSMSRYQQEKTAGFDYALEKARNTANTTARAMSKNGRALQGALDIAKRNRETKKKLDSFKPVYDSSNEDKTMTGRSREKLTPTEYRNESTGETMTVEDYNNAKSTLNSNQKGKHGNAVSSFKGARKRAIEEALQQQADTSWMPEKEPETAKEYADYIDKYYQSLSDPELASLSDEELSAKITSAKDEKEGNKDKLKNYEPVYGSFDSPVLARNITKDTKLAGYRNRLTGETMSAEEHDALEGNTAIDKYENEQSVRKTQKVVKKWAEDYAKLTPEQEQAVMQMYITDHDEEEGATEQEQTIRDSIGSRDKFELIKAHNSAKENLESQGINADDMEEYYSWIHNRQIDTKKRKELEEETKQEGLKGFLINVKESAISVGDSLLTVADSVDQLSHSAKNYFGGDEAYTPYDPYSARFTQSRNRRREAVSNDIDSNIGKFLYDVGMSMADSAAAMATGSEPVSLGIMAASAGSQAYVDASERGVDTNKAAAIGIANAAAEAGFEKLSLDHLYGMVENPTKTTFKKKILDWAVQSGIEGSEEVFTDFADEAADRMINGGLSEYSTNVKEYMKNGMSEDEAKTAANEQFWNQVRQDFVAGAISGAVFGGVANTVNSVQYHKMGKTINQDNTMRDTILETAEQMPENSTAKQIADTVKADNITDSQMSQIIESMANSEDVNLDKVITEGFVRKGAEQEQAQQQAQKLINDTVDTSTTRNADGTYLVRALNKGIEILYENKSATKSEIEKVFGTRVAEALAPDDNDYRHQISGNKYLELGGPETIRGISKNEDIRHSINVDEKTFAEEYDKWDKKNYKKEFVFRNESFALKKIGINIEKITFDGVKILKILKKHRQMTDEIIKKIPQVINNPIIILQSKKSNSRVVLSGELYDTENNPVVVILELDVKGKGGIKLDEIKVVSAYGKESMQNLIDSSRVQYISKDKEKTSRWIKRTRLQLPFGLTTTGYTDSIAQNQKNTTHFSLDVDSEGRKLSEEQKKYFENSTVRDDNGNLLPMYHGTPNGDFTVFKNDIQFFTPNRWYADFYQEPSASSRKAGKTVTNKKTYEVYLNITKPFDIRNPETKEIFINDYVKGGYALGINPYEEYKDTTNSGLPSWEEADNIYEFLEDNDLLDEYDGIIVDEGGFPGEDGKIVQRGISYVTFNQNQIKNVDNKKPTADPDIRHSVDIDEDLMAILEEEYSDTEKEMGSIIEDGFKALENVSIDDKTMRKIASEVKQEYKSTYNAKELADNLTKVFAYLKDTKNVSYEDMVRIVQEIAMPVIEESTDVDSVEADVYNSFRKTLKGQKIRLNEAQKKEVAHYYDSYDKFRKMNFGNITFSEDGMYLDSLWDELCQSSNYILDMDTAVNDQPIALIDAMNEMKPAKHNIFGMNKQQAAYDLALDIYRRFFIEQSTDAANKKVLAETQKLIAKQQEYRKNLNAEYRERFEKLKEQEKTRRDSLKQKYERALDEQRRELSSAMAYRDAKAETEIRKKIKSYEAKLAKVKQQSNDKYMKLKAAQSENRTAKRNIEERRRYRERIRKNAQGIVTAFNQNTDKNHVPDALKKTVADFIDAIDFTTDRTNPNSVNSLKWYNALSQMQLKLSSEREAIAGDYEDIYNALMDGNSGDRKTSSLLDDISDFLNNNEGVRISDMDMNGLRYLDRLVSGLKRAITSVNQLYVNERAQNVEELGDNTIEELKTKKDKKVWNNDTLRGKAINKAENMLDANMLDPRSYFYRMGDSALSIYKGLRKGLNTRTEKIAEAQDYMQSQFGKIAEECGLTEKQLKSEMKKWTGRDAEVHEFDFGNKKLRMTTAQMMGLYELKNREQAKEHIKYGGVITTTKAGTKVYRNSEGIRLTEYEVGKICEELTPEQKKVADSMQQFMQNRCSAWGNATTMQMYGYRRFGGQHYYPIKTSGNTVDTKDQTSYWGVKNQGFTKKTMKNARNAIVVDDIFDVFTKHVTDMASYGSYTAALSDAMKWFNYRQKAGLDEHMSEDEVLDILNSKTSVKAQIERAYGKEYQEYFKKLVQDINAEGTGDVQVKFVDELVGNMKAASVAANIRVAIQQPTAYFRAMAVMDSKYLLKALTMKPAVHEVQEKAPIAKWKSWGYFETSIGQSMKEVITDQHTFKEELQEGTMILAQKADDVTWGVLWNAVKQETKALHPDIDVNSKEFTDLCVDRYDELIDQTQVVDSVLHRSQIMRSNNGLHKMVTSFMAEPTKSYNMLANALRDWYEMPGKWNAGSKRFFKQTLKAYIITNVVNAAVQSFMDAFRDKKDDDTTYWERWLEDYKDNVIDNLNPVQLIPYLKDVFSIAQGYDVNRLDMQGLSKLFAGVRNVQKYATDADYRENHTWLEAAESLMSGISSVTGIPIYNVERDFKAIYNTTTGKYLGGIKRKNSRQYERMLDAYLSGDNAAYKEIEGELKEKGLEQKEITSKVKKEIKDGYLAGGISEKEAKKFLKEKAGQSDEEIWCTLEEWNYGETYQRLYDAIDNSINKGADRDAIFDYISEAKSKGGKENKDISGVVTREYKKKYLKAKEKGKYADMKNLLISIYMHLGYTNAEANKKIEEWSKKKTK